MSIVRRMRIYGVFLAAVLFLSACGGESASDIHTGTDNSYGENSAIGGSVSEGAVSGSAVSGGAVKSESVVSGDAIQADAALAMAEANADILRGIPNSQAVQLCAMVIDRRIWLQNRMEPEDDKELKEDLEHANYGRGLYYAVTDLDQNGELEILTSSMAGSGRFSFNGICGYDSRTASIRQMDYGGEKEDGDIGGYDIGGVEKTSVYVAQDGTYHYAFTDFARAGAEDYAKISGVLTLTDDVVIEDVCGVADTYHGKTKYYVDDQKVGEADYEEKLDKELRGVKEGDACFGWNIGRGGLVGMDDEKLLKKLVDSWQAFQVNIPD